MPLTPATTIEPSPAPPEANAVAPVWHTACVLLFLLGLVALGLFVLGGDFINHAHNRPLIYAITMAIEWLIVAFIAFGARWQGASLRTLTGGNSPQWRYIALDLGLAIAFLIAANIVLGIVGFILGHLTHAAPNAAIKNFLPHTSLEIALWLLMSLTAAIYSASSFSGPETPLPELCCKELSSGSPTPTKVQSRSLSS